MVIPIRDRAASGLRVVLRYTPRHDRAPKMLVVAGTTLGLIPSWRAVPSGFWSDGPPDIINAGRWDGGGGGSRRSRMGAGVGRGCWPADSWR
ncbi:MAG: hypothetical protein WBP81_13125 [Solirubrobacteraceae bacterium]